MRISSPGGVSFGISAPWFRWSSLQARRALNQLSAAYQAGNRLIAPSLSVFADAGRVLQQLGDRGRQVRRAALVHDVLIALSARSLGATLVTANAGDFEAIQKLVDFALRVAV